MEAPAGTLRILTTRAEQRIPNDCPNSGHADMDSDDGAGRRRLPELSNPELARQAGAPKIYCPKTGQINNSTVRKPDMRN